MKSLIYWRLALLLALLLFGFGGVAAAQVSYQGRHVMFLESGVDSIYGNYWFVVENPTGEPQPLKMPIMMPVETADWQIQEGVLPNEVHLGSDGVSVEKNFPPEQTMVAFGFMVPAALGATTLTFKAPFAISDLQILVPEGGVAVEGDSRFQRTPGVEFSGRRFTRYGASNIAAGDTFTFKASSIPEGRRRLWVIGAALGLCLLLGGGGLAWRTKPKVDTDQVDVTG